MRRETTIHSRKISTPTVSGGSLIKRNPGDRAGKKIQGFWMADACFVGSIRRYSAINHLTLAAMAEITGVNKMTVKGWLGRRPGRNGPITKHDFMKIVKAAETPETYEAILSEIGNVETALPADIEYSVFINEEVKKKEAAHYNARFN